jgi:hypothetical protein
MTATPANPARALWPGQPTRPVRRPATAAAVAVVVAAVAHVSDPVYAFVEHVVAGGDDVDRLLRVEAWWWVPTAAQFTASVVAAVPVIVWLRRTRVNLEAFPDARPQIGPSWAVTGWFVPIANLVMPYRVVSEVARFSVRNRSMGALVAVWWIAFVVYGVGSRYVALRSAGRAVDIPTVIYGRDEMDTVAAIGLTDALEGVVPTLAGLVAAACFALVALRISAAQEERIAGASA